MLTALTLLLGAWYAFWACAPPSSFRSMSVDLDRPSEFGAGYTYAAPFPGADPGCELGLLGCEGGGVQLWYQHRLGRRVTLGGNLFGAGPSGIGGGLLTRFHLVEAERFRFGTDVDVGFLWAGVSLPLAARVAPDLWVYTAPTVQVSNIQFARFPLGLGFGATESMWLHGEGSLGWNPNYHIPTWTVGGALSYRF